MYSLRQLCQASRCTPGGGHWGRQSLATRVEIAAEPGQVSGLISKGWHEGNEVGDIMEVFRARGLRITIGNNFKSSGRQARG